MIPHASTIKASLHLYLKLLGVFHQPDRDLPPTVYHYADAQALMGIARTKSLWATDHRFLNDSLELEHARLVIERVAETLFAEAADDTAGAQVLSCVNRRDYEPDDDRAVAYLCCFSSMEDGLSQWRAYARGVGGYALGFDTRHLRRVATALDSRGFKASLVACEYKDEVQDRHVTDALQWSVMQIQGLPREHWHDAAQRLLATLFASISAVYKHPSFADEREWRFVIQRSPTWKVARSEDNAAIDRGSDVGRSLPVQFRSAEFTLVPYLALPLALGEGWGLRKVVVGPTPMSGRAASAVRELLGDPAIAVSNSLTPFRRV